MEEEDVDNDDDDENKKRRKYTEEKEKGRRRRREKAYTGEVAGRARMPLQDNLRTWFTQAYVFMNWSLAL